MCCRELRRLRDEGESRFRDRSLLHQRYRMGNLLGKGRFSDVYLVSVVNLFFITATRFCPLCMCAHRMGNLLGKGGFSDFHLVGANRYRVEC